MRRSVWAAAAVMLAACSADSTSPGAPVASIKVVPPFLVLVPDSLVQLSTILLDSAGKVLQGRGVTWATPDTALITISGAGIVKARAIPSGVPWTAVRIEASAEGRRGVAWATLVRRIDRLGVLPDTLTLRTGQSADLQVVVFDSSGAAAFAGGPTWSSSDSTRATVDSLGTVRAVRVGVATIVSNAAGLSGSGTVRVLAPAVHVAIAPRGPSLLIGESVQLTATVRDSAGNLLADRPVSWSVAGSAMATVGTDGLVTARAGGSTQIVAAVEGAADTVTLTASADGAFATVAAGDVHTCAITTTGTTYCWGNGWYGQLGTNSGWSDYYTSPTRVIGGVTFQSLTARGNHTCGLDAAGVAYCWGSDDFGALGNTSADIPCNYAVPCRGTPLAIADTAHYTWLSAGGYHTCGLTTDGVAKCWGGDVLGQLGIGSADGLTHAPTPVSGGTTFATIEAGSEHTCGLTGAGAAYCWGADLSTPVVTSPLSTTPVTVGGPAFVALATGYYHVCGLTAAGATWCWGNGVTGAPTSLIGGSAYAHLTGGRGFACALDAGGTAYCWGDNSWGQLGNGTTTRSPVPVLVSGGLRFTALAAGGYHVCGLATSGKLYCWGDDYNGEIGDGSMGGLVLTPTLVLGQP